MINEKRTMMVHGERMDAFGDSSHLSGKVNRIRQKITDSIRAKEDEIIHAAIKRFYRVDDVFQVANLLECFFSFEGERQFVDKRTKVTVVSMKNFRIVHNDGRLAAAVDFYTFDGRE